MAVQNVDTYHPMFWAIRCRHPRPGDDSVSTFPVALMLPVLLLALASQWHGYPIGRLQDRINQS